VFTMPFLILYVFHQIVPLFPGSGASAIAAGDLKSRPPRPVAESVWERRSAAKTPDAEVGEYWRFFSPSPLWVGGIPFASISQ